MISESKAEGETWHAVEVKSWRAGQMESDGWEVRRLDADGLTDHFVAFCVIKERAESIAADHQQTQRLEQAVDALKKARAGFTNGSTVRSYTYANRPAYEIVELIDDALAALTPPAEQPGGRA